ncbi:RNA polymerase III subunit Rpc25-domain-containing protein [Boletus reticuloceps]|uniref:RNA polymerase III subunit Rpc25-domain-containing protein n=1 Tax=Boletus reticuloceps TaxID=495285 RepID=A0A8I3ADX2_9AGAM|nr:RNA polymerase III subunit Rpc25-domain-containing protein [Boletus reticuloceps]
MSHVTKPLYDNGSKKHARMQHHVCTGTDKGTSLALSHQPPPMIIGHDSRLAAKFRMVVFRPFASEVILAKVKSSDEDGIRLSVGFFDDMYIPLAYLPQPSTFDPNERAHFWLPDSEATSSHELLESPTTDRMYIDQGEIVRVRVEADEFYDDEPGPPKAAEGVVIKREARRPPYTIIGLGPVPWWKSAQPAGDQG